MKLQLFGVDYYNCTNCGEIFPDCSDECLFCGCGESFCCDSCAVEAGSKYGEYGDVVSCKYCRKEDYTDDVLLCKALKALNMTREEFVESLKE